MNDIEYGFGTGDGAVHVWSSPADLDLARTGTADAIQMDFDGDGLADDALWDSHGTGIADVAALDLDDDGVLDHFYTDPTGLGTWNHQITGAAADANSEPLDWIVRTGPDPLAAPQNAADPAVTEALADYPIAPEPTVHGGAVDQPIPPNRFEPPYDSAQLGEHPIWSNRPPEGVPPKTETAPNTELPAATTDL
ncbi:hypothetical protein APR12_003981 [Nocardia amikacinitolerans]|uniref:hypothetical protein n=1 Tax=Nocardia amikacinitolerans TaxID=756689 RepID=UPI0008304860|nr:hypothetical protein [Nocardia amikacinitolerans]MCP2318626.1 hypothetical protein [Nocardia amikacinitolerans]